MSIIHCPDCGERISIDKPNCENCGYSVQDYLIEEHLALIKKQEQILEGKPGKISWISFMRVCGYIFVIATITFGVIFSVVIGKEAGVLIGVFIAFSSIFFAFLSVALVMIFLNVAEDVSEIKKSVNKK